MAETTEINVANGDEYEKVEEVKFWWLSKLLLMGVLKKRRKIMFSAEEKAVILGNEIAIPNIKGFTDSSIGKCQ